MRLSDVLGRAASSRVVHGISAVLLPYRNGHIDWEGFQAHVARTAAAELDVAVNMDTGFGDLLDASDRAAVLDATREALGPDRRFYASAFGGGADPVAAYHESIAAVQARGAVPIVVQCREMHGLAPVALADLYARIVAVCDAALAFELGPVFAPHGTIWDAETFARILDVPAIVGAKHSSLDRRVELDRLAVRDAQRPEFRVYTGNDLAIDMVLYGSDYLLGLSTFHPEAFSVRDRWLAEDDARFLALDDALQYLGDVGFRAPVPAYKHSAATALQLLGHLPGDEIHPKAPRRAGTEADHIAPCLDRVTAALAAPPT